jgi:NAD(P)-dependent dehydrogenase (short-subunit alcohol dehydrogenase family)
MKDFSQKVAVVTGAGSGMGRYLAVLLAKAGCDVVICDVNEDTLADTATMLKNYNVAVSSHRLDVGDEEAIKALPEKVIAQHGKVDLVFNNAGITIDSDFSTMPEEDWDKVMGVNLHGVINMTRAFLPYLAERPEAAVVNTSSIFGMIAVPRQSVYHATKFAVRGFTESLVKEMKGTSLQVHCVHPGHIGTNILASAKINPAQQENQQRGMFARPDASQEEQGAAFRENGMHASRAAQIILDGVRKRRSRIFVGMDAKLIDLAQRLMPMHYDKLLPLIFLPLVLFRNKKALKDLPAEP